MAMNEHCVFLNEQTIRELQRWAWPDLNARSELAIAPVYKWTKGRIMVPHDTDLTNLPAKRYMLEFFAYQTICCTLPHHDV